MSTLRSKYEALKKQAYVSRASEQDGQFRPRLRGNSSITPVRLSSLSSRYSAYKDSREPQNDGRLPSSLGTSDEFSPIRRIPFVSSSFSPSSLFKSSSPPIHSSLSKRRTGGYGSGGSGGSGRISKTRIPTKGVFQRLGLYVYDKLTSSLLASVQPQTSIEIQRGLTEPRGGKKVWFADNPMVLPPVGVPDSGVEDILAKERERYHRLKNSYEQELRRLEDELDLKDQEINSTREILTVREIREQERLAELENSFQENLIAERRAEEEKFSEHRRKLRELELQIKEQQEVLKRESESVQLEKSHLVDETERVEMERSRLVDEFDRVQLERNRLVDELKEVELKREKYKELDEKRLKVLEKIKQQKPPQEKPQEKPTTVNTPMNLRATSKYQSTKETLNNEKKQIKSEIEENNQQLLQFLESLVEISKSISSQSFPDEERETLLSNLELLVTGTGGTQLNHPNNIRISKLSSLKVKLDEYLKSFKQVNSFSHNKKSSLRLLFENLERNLLLSFGKRKRNVEKLNHEIFKVNLMLADSYAITSVLGNSIGDCLKYLRIFERKSSFLEEMLLLNDLLFKLSYMLLELELELTSRVTVVTSTPRFSRSRKNKDKEEDVTFSPIDISTYFADLDKLIGTY